jgi:hypothetical protein
MGLVSLGTLPDEQLKDALLFCYARVGVKYDWAAICGFVLPFGKHENNRRFCSDSCVEVMQRSVVADCLSRRIAQGVGQLVRWRTNPARLYRAVSPTSRISIGPVIHGVR